jgi:tetratricopeptide (TPR) repeat protein
MKAMKLRTPIVLLSIMFQAAICIAAPRPVTTVNLAPPATTDVARYVTLLNANPEDVAANNSLGFSYLKAGDLQNAEKFLLRAVKTNPNFAVAFNNLGVVYLKSMRYELAIAAFRSVLDIDRYYSRARFNLALALFRNGEYLTAVAEIKALRRLDEEYLKLRHNKDKTRAEMDRAMARNPGSSILVRLWKIFQADNYFDFEDGAVVESPPTRE